MNPADAASSRTRKALEAGGFADMRPAYRAMLRHLKKQDAARFDEATRRYEEELVPALTDGERDPIAAWVEYGAWLAGETQPGRLVRLDETGLSSPAEPEARPGHVLLYLPDGNGERAIPILRPADPTPAQQAALELLARQER